MTARRGRVRGSAQDNRRGGREGVGEERNGRGSDPQAAEEWKAKRSVERSKHIETWLYLGWLGGQVCRLG